MKRRSLFVLAALFTGLALAACQRHSSLYMDDDSKASPAKTPDAGSGAAPADKAHKP